MKILYIFAGTRKRSGDDSKWPTTSLYGLRVLQKLGIDVSNKEFDDVYPRFLSKILSFNLRHMLMYFPSRKYDVVFGSALLPMMIIKRLLPGKTKYVLLNISLTRLLASQKRGSIKSKIIKCAVAGLDAIICLSHTQAEFLRRSGYLTENRIYTVSFGIDTDFYSRGSTRNDGTIISVGRDNGRDYNSVFEIARRLPERKFIIICSKRNVLGLSIPSNVTVIYDIPPNKVRELYHKSDIFLLMTYGGSHNDGADCSGQTALLEAMATGLPAVLSENQCLLEYVVPGGNVFVVKPHDIDAAVDSIKKIEDKIKRKEMSDLAERTVHSRYTTEKMAKQLLSIFQVINKS